MNGEAFQRADAYILLPRSGVSVCCQPSTRAPDPALCCDQDMGYHIETVHTKLPSLLDPDGWSSELRARSITTRVLFRKDSDPSLRGASCAQMPQQDRPPTHEDTVYAAKFGRHSLSMQKHHKRGSGPRLSLHLISQPTGACRMAGPRASQ